MRTHRNAAVVAFCTIVALPVGLSASTGGASVQAKAAFKLKVTVSEWLVKPAREFIAAGKTRIVVKNAGNEEHELLVVRGDDPDALPTKPDGSIDESKIPEKKLLGEVEDVKPHKTKSNVFKLKPGSYILFCNIVDEEGDKHFMEGMHAVVDVS